MIAKLQNIRRQNFFKLYRTGILFCILSAQCTWTPEVTTPIHASNKGAVVLETSRAFKRPPQHPHVFSESLIKQILQGISQTHEQGLLQELFFSDNTPSPVFSPAQVEFLTPYLVEAFSKVTPEELITFHIHGNDERADQISGIVATFSPTTFLLILQGKGHNPKSPSKITSASRNPREHTTLIFSQKQAMLPVEEAQRLLNISHKDIWIAIDYVALSTEIKNGQKVEERNSTTPERTPKVESTQPELNAIQEELQDLRKKVDEQAEEIQRLQHTPPQ